VNPVDVQYKTYMLVFNSGLCDNALTLSEDTAYTFTLPKPMKNVVQLKLAALQYPNVQYTFSSLRGNNILEIFEQTTNLARTIIIPGGNYDITQFPSILEYQINMAFDGSYALPTPTPNSGYTPPYPFPSPQVPPNRYSVTINPYTYQTTITNLLGIPFTLILDKPTWATNVNRVCPRTTSATVAPELLFENNVLRFQTLGYGCGFRKIIYATNASGNPSSSYTSESVYDNQIVDYIFFSLNDYQLNRTDGVIGVFPNFYLEDDIMAIVPVTSAPFTSFLDSGANFIYKTRNYYGPVNISKIDVQFYGPFGIPIPLFGSQFSFTIEFKVQYDNPVNSNNAKAHSIVESTY